MADFSKRVYHTGSNSKPCLSLLLDLALFGLVFKLISRILLQQYLTFQMVFQSELENRGGIICSATRPVVGAYLLFPRVVFAPIEL